MSAASAPTIVIVDDNARRAQGVREAAALRGRQMVWVRWGPQVRPLIRLLGPQLVIAGVSTNVDAPAATIRAVREDGYTDPIVVIGKGTDSLRAAGASECVGSLEDADLARVLARLPARFGVDSAGRDGAPPRFVHFGDAVVDLHEATVLRGERMTRMSPTGRAVFAALFRQAGVMVSRSALRDEVWPGETVTPRAIDQHVSRLRRQLEEDPRRPRHLHTVFGRGYRLDA